MAKTLDKLETFSEKNLKELKKALLEEQQFYMEENARMEVMFKKIGIDPNIMSVTTKNTLNKLSSLQEKYESKQCDTNSILLSHTDRLQRQSNYMNEIKNCIKVYSRLIERVSKDINISKRELERAEKELISVGQFSNDELKSLLMKSAMYEKEVLKFEKRNPWLLDPRYTLQHLSKETDILNSLRAEKNKLIQELDVYKGLKPDINEASQQLTSIKRKCDSNI